MNADALNHTSTTSATSTTERAIVYSDDFCRLLAGLARIAANERAQRLGGTLREARELADAVDVWLAGGPEGAVAR